MRLSEEWIIALWAKIQDFKALFWAPEHAEWGNFHTMLMSPGWLFFEVYKAGLLTGLVYFTNVPSLVNVQVHCVMFDRKMSDKVDLAQSLILWLFEEYPVERVEVVLPTPYRATARFIERVGFKHDGTRRKALIHRGVFTHEDIYSIIREDLCLS